MEYNVEKISNNIEKEKIFNNIIKKILILIIIILFIMSTIFITNDDVDNNLNNIFGIYMFVIVSGSMQPTINENDIIIVKKCTLEEIELHDIITFVKDDKIISHRVIYLDKNIGIIYTKGDNNESIDWNKVDIDSIYGKIIYKIPKIGKFIRYLHSEKNYFKIITIIFIIYIIISLKNEEKNKRNIKRKKYEIKKKRDNYN